MCNCKTGGVVSKSGYQMQPTKARLLAVFPFTFKTLILNIKQYEEWCLLGYYAVWLL
jgi:hypothetical protein